MACQDDVLPLNKPITTSMGESMHGFAYSQGNDLFNLHCGLQQEHGRLVFDPEHRLDGRSTKKDVSAFIIHSRGWTKGMYLLGISVPSPQPGTLTFFTSGTLEMHAFFAELTTEAERTRREPCGIMKGDVEKGVQLPLKVKLASREEPE
ncbi:uncharacterized protein EV420DRAFT_1646270 [Desarmillaria tabescens]|uniref:Uncharacterized protein n=1 Tax=Armillaria tabescens TaxID=1929756 RepID=A0AA39K0L4_ARMTA|nr:uncharacterized protein EV420DRAFT_1646270 [Desarmillaria tabescens]KAK0451196.1 hypothetical protein EV420DRAFT_1646270 [Desarmillaria tabescens]